jgi:hypothetical protein
VFPREMVCLRNISVDTLHKGDTEENDDDDDNNNNNNNNNNKVIITKNYKKYILKQPNNDELCRGCRKELETIQHITAACEKLAPNE